MVKIVKFGVVVLNDSVNSFNHVIDVFQEIFCWDITQSHNCANVIHNKGEYAVKWFDHEKSALFVAELLRSRGLKTKIIIDRDVEID